MGETDEKNEKYNVKVVERCLDILDLAAQTDGQITVQQVMNALSLNANMAYRLLTTMVNSGYLSKDPENSGYSVSLKALALSQRALTAVGIRKSALPYMEMLWKQFPKSNVNLGVLYGGEIIVIDRIDSQTVPRTFFTPGKKVPFYASGLGKVLSSELDEAAIDAMIAKAGGLRKYTVRTITDRAVLMDELALVRERGYGIDREELILNDNCNAAPIRDSTGKIIGAVSMSAFDNFISRAEMDEHIHFICETARQISYFLGNAL
jgi:DNA-binding IclR family transcriptional regulator